MNMELVDSQVNFGKSVFGPVCDLDYFDRQARLMNVTRAIVIPTLTHELKTADFTEQSCIWSVENGRVVYRKKLILRNGTEREELNPSNPYALMNTRRITNLLSSRICAPSHFFQKFLIDAFINIHFLLSSKR